MTGMDISGLLEKAHQEMKVGRYEQALESYGQVLATEPSNLTDLANKGKAYYYLGRHEDAITWYDRALAVNPANAPVLYEKGYTLRKVDRYEDAIRSFDRALEFNPINAFIWHTTRQSPCVTLAGIREADECLRMANYQTGITP